MKTFQVITDSTSDMEKKFRDEYDVDYFRMSFSIDDIEHKACLDWSEVKADDYYGFMRNGKRSFTSFPSKEEFEEKMKKYLDQGLDILYVACSSKLSAARNQGEKIAEALLPNYPGRRVVCYDSLRSNYAEGLMAMDAAKMANEGKTIDDVIAYFEENKLKYQVHAIVGNLEYLKRAGRVKASKAFFGNLMQMKPMLCSDVNGNNYAYEKVMGRKKSIERLIEVIVERMENPAESILFIEHADCLEDALYVKEQVASKINPKEINISNVGPIIGATVGPDTITVSFFGEKVTVFDPE